MDKPISELDYMEAQERLQILEHTADKGPLSQGNLALQRELEAREKDLVRAKISQAFDAAPVAANSLDNRKTWKKAAEYTEFPRTAEGLAERHLQNDAKLAGKQQQGIRKFGPSAELEGVQAGERKLQSRHYDEERGRYAREFLRAREIAEQVKENEKQQSLEPRQADLVWSENLSANEIYELP
jgi:hypothetical protein